MDLFIAHFGKKVGEIKYDDIENFFLFERTESDTIEFKSISPGDVYKQINILPKTICAFLNSSGGIIILGAPDGKHDSNNKKKKFFGPLTPNENKIEKDQFISSTSDSIVPIPLGINYYPFEKDNKFIYLIEVKKSEYSPHQYNNTYYMRLDGQIKPAPHHYIEALFKKIAYPELEGFIKFKNPKYLRDYTFQIPIDIHILNWSPSLNELNLHYQIQCQFCYIQQSNGPENTAIFENVKNILTYGSNYNTRQILMIEKLANKEKFIAKILLTYGGKISPLKLTKIEFEVEFPDEKTLKIGMLNETTSIWAKDELDLVGYDRRKIQNSLKNANKIANFDGRITKTKNIDKP